MRSIGIFGTVLVMGLSLAACTQQGGGADADGRVARRSADAGARGATPAQRSSTATHARFAALPDRGELLRYEAQAPVRAGARHAGQAEIVEGLQAGDRIVVDGTGKLRPRETVAEGIAAAPEAFLGLLKGKNFGKQLVKLI